MLSEPGDGSFKLWLVERKKPHRCIRSLAAHHHAPAWQWALRLIACAWALVFRADRIARRSLSTASVGLSSQVHIDNQCEVGGLRLAAAGAEGVQARGLVAPDAAVAPLSALPSGPGPEAPLPVKPGGPARPRDPNMCFFEGHQRPHGARWAPNYDPLCSLCTCQVRGQGRMQWVPGMGPSTLSKPTPLSAEANSDL